jgi:hypothetical protein
MADTVTFPFRTRSGRLVTEADVERLVEEIESDDFDISTWVARPVGRPPLGSNGPAPRVQFRIDADLYRRVRDKAAREHRTISAIARQLFEKYATS